ncbi:MAG: 5'-nucleotidase C-terminal domain-containing protein [Elusimicrobia bacterium]|nr:5'-nucleotidase C-terminal domain-containing protein [Elusimicrobiota bacterium]
MKKLLTALLLALPLSAWSLTVDIYHTSDAHGWYYSRPAKWDKENSTRTIGGFAALSALVSADKNPHILLDSGDTFQGTPEGTLTKGMATAAMMNQLGYSACDIGNHDYDYTEDSLRTMVKASSFPWLGANVYVKETGKAPDYLKPYTVVTVAGKRIAVLGIAGKHTATSTLPVNVKHLEFRDESQEAARWARIIRENEKPDALVVLSHTGFGLGLSGKKDLTGKTYDGEIPPDSTLAIARASGADVVIGGHNHAGITRGYRDPVSGALIAESYWGLTDVSRISLNFDDKTGKLTGDSDELLPLWTDVTGEDQKVVQTLKGFSAKVDKEMGKVIGRSEVDLGSSRSGLDSDIGNWFTDAMRRQSGADVAFQNTPGIRSDLKAGDIRMRDIFQVMPFENTLVTLTLTGEQLRRLMAANLPGGFSKLQVSGLKVTFRSPSDDPANITLERDGKPVGDGERFKVATNNYLTTGGTGGAVFSEDKNAADTMLPIRDLLIKDIMSNPIKSRPEGGRIVRLD